MATETKTINSDSYLKASTSKTIDLDAYLKRTYGGQQTSTAYTDMISLYHMNEPSWSGVSGEVIDSKGSNNGYAMSDTTTTKAKHLFGTYCGDFSADDVGLSLGANSSFHVVQPSVAVWIYPTSYSNDYNDIVNAGRYYVTIRSTGKIEFYAYIGSWINAVSNSAITLNKWHLIVATYDGSNAKLYIDNVLQSTQGAGSGSITWAGNNVYVGQNGTGSQKFKGKMDELSFYNVAISQARITDLWKENTMLFGDSYIKKLAIEETINSDVYIQKSDSNTLNSNAYIKEATSETIASDAYIKLLGASKTLNSDSYILKAATKTLSSDAYINKTGAEGALASDMFIGYIISNTLNSDSYILEATSKTLASDYYIKKIDTEKTLNSDACIDKSISKTLVSDAYILEATSKTLDSDYYIKNIDNTETLTSDAWIGKLPTGSLNSNMQIGLPGVTKTLTSDAYIKEASSNALNSDAYIKEASSKTINSNSYISKSTSETLTSDCYIAGASISQTITDDSHIAIEGFWSDEWEVEFVLPISVAITQDAHIKAFISETLTSDYYITKESEGGISSDSYIKLTSATNINSNYCIRRSDGTKPCICEARYINKPTICEAEYISKPIIVSANSLSYNETMVNTPTPIAHSKTLNSNAYITI